MAAAPAAPAGAAPAEGATVFVDYAAAGPVAAMIVGGMTVVERVLREAARAGARRAVVRAGAAPLPALPPLPLPGGVELLPAGAPAPAGAAPLPGDVIAGVRISDEASRRAASRALFQTCRRPYDGLGDRYVNRAISLRLTRLLCRLRATPNQVTTINIGVGLAACAAAARGTAAATALAGALMFLQIIPDSCDGELARIRHLHSRFGMWLDNTSDDVIDNLFVAMLGVGLGGPWLAAGIAAATARGLCALMIHVDVARRGKPGDVMAFRWWFDRDGEELAERFEHRLTPGSVLRSIGRRDLYVLLWAAACLAQLPAAALVLGAAISAIQLGLAAAHLAATAAARRRAGR